MKLGLAGGAALDDPKGLLQGTGKVHRYVQLREAGDMERPGVSELVEAASAACRKRLAARESGSWIRDLP